MPSRKSTESIAQGDVIQENAQLRNRDQVPVRLVDCDVHTAPRDLDEILQYMEEPWRSRSHLQRGLLYSNRPSYTFFHSPLRLDSFAPDGSPPGSDPAVMQRQLFGDAGIDFAITGPFVTRTVDPDHNLAICRAFNRWQSDTWLSKYNAERRFLGSIVVSVDDPAAAAREIDEWADNRAFAQILIGHFSERPLGYPQYDPIWSAATRHSLPVAMHFAGAGQSLGLTPVGPYQTVAEYHSLEFPLVYATHLVSWICSGVFDRYPDLRIVFLEGGFLWYRPTIARLACHWDATSSQILATRNDPMQYVINNVRFASQPIEEADPPRDVASLLEIAHAERVLLFATDYPHFDYDSPNRALPPGLSASTKRRILSENASELYGLPKYRSASVHDREKQSL